MKRTIKRRTEILIETYEITMLGTSSRDSVEAASGSPPISDPDPSMPGLVGRAVMRMKNKLKAEPPD